MSRALAGSLRERVGIMRRVAGDDALGAPLAGWSEIALVWASVRPGSRLRTSDDGVAALGRCMVVMRPCAIREGDRISRTAGELIAVHVTRDPATPEQIVVEAEELR